MPDRHIVAVDGTALLVAALVGCQMRHDLMTVEVEVNPLGRAPSFGATQ